MALVKDTQRASSKRLRIEPKSQGALFRCHDTYEGVDKELLVGQRSVFGAADEGRHGHVGKWFERPAQVPPHLVRECIRWREVQNPSARERVRHRELREKTLPATRWHRNHCIAVRSRK